MRFVSLVLSGCLALHASAEETVAELIRSLGDDRPAVRERAQAELESRGDAIIPELEAAIRGGACEDPEIQARLGTIVAQARQANAWAEDPGPLARAAISEEVCATCGEAEYEIEGELTEEAFARLAEEVKLFHARCPCRGLRKAPASTGILFLSKSGDHTFLRRGHVSRLREVAHLLRPALKGEEACETAAALVALGRHGGSVRVLEGARQTAAALPRPEGGFRVSLKDLGDEVFVHFDAEGRLVYATRADG